ncbi:hypothetical protein D3OALGB2SA_3927 [Olavius algarvensis associated proteobacterium Delta 3]|nr:hypothetical protein D3OALGB2SA_3927 [Olavius algarvensis associated proteobacterium Delta 3]
MAEDRSQMSEVGCPRSDGRGQKAEDTRANGPTPRSRQGGIRGKMQFLCVLRDSAVIVSIFLQKEHIKDK